MPRPYTITGQYMGTYLTEAEIQLTRLIHHFAHLKPSSNPADYEYAIRQAASIITDAKLAIRNATDLLQANGELEAITSDPLLVLDGCRKRVEQLLKEIES